jgi:hypothetical protein
VLREIKNEVQTTVRREAVIVLNPPLLIPLLVRDSEEHVTVRIAATALSIDTEKKCLFLRGLLTRTNTVQERR